MAEHTDDQAEGETTPAPRRRRLGRRIAAVLALLLVVAGIWAWTARERLADDFISGQLDKLGLNARYKIESIGPRRQVITGVVVGDPDRPDLTIERIEVTLEPRFPLPGIGKVRLVRPRLYGSYRGGKLSFGTLDPLLFERETTEPFSFPNLVLQLDDARALMESDYGPVGFKVQGSGNLRGGFAGILAANAPEVTYDGCRGQGATLYGKVTIDAERPGFAGPLRLASLDCPERQVALKDAAVEIDARMDRNFAGLDGKATLGAGHVALGEGRLGQLAGSGRYTWREDALTAQYELAADAISTPQALLGKLALDGSVRSHDGFSSIEVQANVTGEGLRPGGGLDRSLAEAAAAADGTLAGPMLGQIRTSLAREGRGSALEAEMTLRKLGDALSLVMPQARLRGSSGESLLALSRFQLAGNSQGGTPRFSGNFSTGGKGLPRLSGRMEGRGGRSGSILKMSMAEYRVGGGSLELPELTLTQGADGTVGFAGSARASGLIPGGSTEGLDLPIKGSWSAARGLAMWRECTALSFEKLTIASLALDKRRLELCPPTGGAILKSDRQGTHFAAGTPALELTGTLGETPIRLDTGAVGFAWPGNLTARDVKVSLGAAEAPTRFTLSEIDAELGGEIGGTFAGTDALLYAVPLDVLDAAGSWRYADGRLELSQGSFRLIDRQKPGRFEPLVARDAVLSLADNRIAASALLREPKSDREIVTADIHHDLGSGIGYADLGVPGIRFDDRLQPDTLSGLMLGLVANAQGTVTGEGRIDWNPEQVTSTGRFGTGGLDFAAAFGPVEGVSGTVAFSDLLGFVTEPDQVIHIRQFNPGIQVDSGEMTFEIRPDYLMVIKGGSWPFIGGRLFLEPAQTHMNLPEERRYTLRLEGVDAALFIERMELANISATGTFDGRVPLVFDENGGRIEGGTLSSRPPGGNLSYVGKLTYEDMTPIANYAFAALKSLDFRKMDIDLNGSLTGEVVTKVRFDGIRQGEAASKNIVTKQLAKLPLRFNVNIRAPFYQLLGTFKSMYDPSAVRDPRTVGLDFPALPRAVSPAPPRQAALKPEDLPDDESGIQPRESEAAP